MKKVFLMLMAVIAVPSALFLAGDNTNSSLTPEEIQEAEHLAKQAAMAFHYYDSPNDFYKGENEIDGQCGDYALRFCLLWNERHPDKPALLVIQNQYIHRRLAFKNGSYKIVAHLESLDAVFRARKDIGAGNKSGLYHWIAGFRKFIMLYHPAVGAYEIKLAEKYSVKKHFWVDMTDKRQTHVWAKIGDVIVDPTYPDVNSSAYFIGKDEI